MEDVNLFKIPPYFFGVCLAIMQLLIHNEAHMLSP